MLNQSNNGPTWILVCDASRARLYQEERRGGGLKLLSSFSHEESRARGRDLMADAQGRKPNGYAGGISPGGTYMGRPGAAADTDPKEVEAEKFVRELADALEKGLDQHAYASLMLIAPPQFLGLLRGAVSTQVAKHIDASVDKDFSWIEPHALEARIRELRAA